MANKVFVKGGAILASPTGVRSSGISYTGCGKHVLHWSWGTSEPLNVMLVSLCSPLAAWSRSAAPWTRPEQ